MDLDRIEQLLERYWECETTLEEEKELKKFFNSGKVPAKWQSVAPLFQYYEEEKKSGKLDGLFDEKIITEIQTQGPPEASAAGKGKVIKLFYNIARVAAVGLILITATYFVREEYINKKDTMDPYLADTFEDPKVAYEETKKALMMISKNFNKGRKEVRKVGVFSEAQDKVKDTEAL
ncbi:hypothetical protein C900_02643 [Fulvivirga imtechensis AK7]|uniref:Uncharacterized protein n=1 Tax=Fulvivirga imtechensis AK7 TaxID=1237149 RepID=L8JZH2_9BACT|nr:hypothetical protein [Fulvivirga imtechensis]ELR73558.1 hypothetical protein C900_02643 [Fulvivirga imtechensis AK7]